MPITRTDKDRIAVYQKMEYLYRGEHAKVFDLDTDSQFPPVVVNIANGILDGLTSLVATKAPRLILNTRLAQARLDAVLELSSFGTQLRSFVREGLLYGDALFKVFSEDNGNVKVRCVSPKTWYSVTNPDDIDEVIQHVLVFMRKTPTGELALLEKHSAGLILFEVYRMRGYELGEQISLEEAAAQVPEWGHLVDAVETGVDEPLIISWSHDKLCSEQYGTGELTCIMDLIRELDMRAQQEASILAKHANPKLILDESMVNIDENGMVAIKELDVLIQREGSDKEKIGYLTWDGKLEAVNKAMERNKQEQLHITQVSRLLLNADSTQAQTGLAVLAQLTPSILKAEGIQKELEQPLRTAMRVAQKLSSVVGKTFSPSPVTIEWGVKLPTDMQASVQAQIMALEAGIISKDEAKENVREHTQ